MKKDNLQELGGNKLGEVKWIKITTQMFEDEKIKIIENMPEADTILIVWIKLLILAGRTNADGYIYLSQHVPYTEEMLATIFNRPITTVRLALETFKQFGMVEQTEARFIKITNWEKHQNVEGLEKIRKQNRLRKQRQREKETTQKLEDSSSRDMSRDVTEQNKNKIKNKNKKEEKETTPPREEAFVRVQKVFDNNIHLITPLEVQIISDWLKDMEADVIIKAIETAVFNNKRYMSYINGILNNWQYRGIKTIKELEAYLRDRQDEKEKKVKSNEQDNRDIGKSGGPSEETKRLEQIAKERGLMENLKDPVDCPY